MSKRAPEARTDSDQILTQSIDEERELLESVEERIDELTDEKYHYSLDVLHTDADSIRIGVYGVEDYELPPRKTVANAVAEQFDWTAAYEDGESMDNYYEMRVEDWEDF